MHGSLNLEITEEEMAQEGLDIRRHFTFEPMSLTTEPFYQAKSEVLCHLYVSCACVMDCVYVQRVCKAAKSAVSLCGSRLLTRGSC